jgi:hypothetical protein
MRERVNHKLGFILILISCVMWVAVLFVPMLPLSLTHKSLFSTGLLLISEAIFWLGIVLSGRELAHRYRQSLNPYHWWQKVGKRKK